jgi:hypothetical protein
VQYIGTSKISKLNPKPNTVYPLIRLPQGCVDSIGSIADIYKTEFEERKAFLVVLGTEEEQESRVIKPVIKLESYRDLNERLSTLESKITELRSLILENQRSLNDLSKNKAPESGFEPESEPRQGSMIGRYTTRAGAQKTVAQGTAY